MSGETIGLKGSYTSIRAAAAVANAAFSVESSSPETALSATEELYPILDFQLIHSSGTPVSGDEFYLYERVSDGTNKAPAPVTDYLHTYVGTFYLDNDAATAYYYLKGVDNASMESTYYVEAATTNTLTVALLVRARTYTAAA